MIYGVPLGLVIGELIGTPIQNWAPFGETRLHFKANSTRITMQYSRQSSPKVTSYMYSVSGIHV
jgi:hypothetical protein